VTVDGAGASGLLLQASVVGEKIFVYAVSYPGILFPWGGSTNSVVDRENWDLEDGSPLVRSFGGS